MTLRRQLQLLISCVVVLTSLAILTVFWVNTARFTREQLTLTFGDATGTFLSLLESREEQLIRSTRLLTSDFGFKQAVATQDAETVASAMNNHSLRLGAELMFLADFEGKVITVTGDIAEQPTLEDAALLESAVRQGSALTVMRLDDRIYQVALVPVRAPIPVALAGVGFELDLQTAEQLKRETGLEITFIGSTSAAPAVSTLKGEQRTAALAADDSLPNLLNPLAQQATWVSRQIPLDANAGAVVLTADVGPYLSEFRLLRMEILAIASACLILGALFGGVLARAVSGPLSQLARRAQQIARGDYGLRTSGNSRIRELGSLSGAIDKMSEEIEARERALLFQAHHDALTGLLNVEGLKNTAYDVAPMGSEQVVIIVGVDGFPKISNAFGSQVSDHYLKACADRISNAVGAGALVARTGSAEFAVICRTTQQENAEAFAASVLDSISSPVAVDEVTLTLTSSAGVAVKPAHGETLDTLLRRASTALEFARAERVRIRCYSGGDEAEQLRSLTLLQDLRRALEADDGQLFMCYQPKLNLTTGVVDKLESLIRWQHPQHGAVSPELFIGLAEQSSLMHTLTDWVIQSVLADRAVWQRDFPNLQVAINIASRDLERDDLLASVERQLTALNLASSALCFELTERDVMGDEAAAERQLTAFHAAGIELSVDDYGVGQSSLARLRQLPVSEIKIDRQFITELEQSRTDQTIVRSTVELCRSFGLRLVAEGVETEPCLTMLREYGCDYAQGYGICRPLNAADITEWLKSDAATARANAA